MTLRALQDLFHQCRTQATGLWKLGREAQRVLFLDGGHIVFATSARPHDRLTALLVERGKLTQVQMDYALANLKPGLSIGRNLIDMGYITQRDLLDVARLQVERIVYGALAEPDADLTFEARELDAGTVRLPLDTPQLLLNGMLEIQDRESFLEMLGPLNQVVVLEGKRYLELSLPADLAKLPPLFDGTHTLLEVGRETPIEPMRLGIFALFLREMGWARLHELPPLDRQALDLALSAPPDALAPPLPEPPAAEFPSLFATIQAAERPTTNLEHLSQAFDSMELPEALTLDAEFDEAGLDVAPTIPGPYVPEAIQLGAESELRVETGQAILPTPNFELPEVPELPEESEPALRVLVSSLPDPEEAPGPDPVPEPPETSSTGTGRWVALGLACGLVALGVGWWWRQRPVPVPRPRVVPAQPLPSPTPGPRTAAPVVPQAAAETKAAPTEPKVVPAQQAPPAQPPEKPAPRPPAPQPAPPPAAAKVPVAGKPVPPSARLEAIRKGDLAAAVRLSEGAVKTLANQWVIRLEIVAQVDTVKKAPGYFRDREPELLLLPFTMRDGRTCYQVLLGGFPDARKAEVGLRSLPAEFRAGGNRPLVFRVGELSRKQ
jgi:hypothetical protein